MARGQGHKGRSIDERREINRYVREQDYTPTVRATGNSSGSTSMGENLAEPTARRTRPRSFKVRFREHLSEHWIEWLVGSAVLVAGYFSLTAQLKFAEVDHSLKTVATSVESIAEEVKGLSNSVQAHRVAIGEDRVKIEQAQSLVQLLVSDRLKGNSSRVPIQPVPDRTANDDPPVQAPHVDKRHVQ